ncbi:MAG: glycosyltransferase, partial [Oligoflexia bacterium]|nr:glycosyltransferase [Oligoflexia bacterium]
MQPTLALVVPLFNEEAAIEGVVRTTLATVAPLGDRVRLVLVDNGSTDGTAAVLAGLAPDPRLCRVCLPTNRGYGGGILAGLG